MNNFIRPNQNTEEKKKLKSNKKKSFEKFNNNKKKVKTYVQIVKDHLLNSAKYTYCTVYFFYPRNIFKVKYYLNFRTLS